MGLITRPDNGLQALFQLTPTYKPPRQPAFCRGRIAVQIRLTLNWTRFPPLIWQILQFRGMGKVSLIQIMQKLTGSVPRPTSLSGVLCGRYAVGLCLKRQDRLSFAQAGENASGCPPARRARLGCDCSSLSPLTLKPLRSATPHTR